MLLEDNTRLVKIFLHITQKEQINRFRARLTDPLKRWKLSYEDFRNHARWKDYEVAIEDMFETTSTNRASWYLVPANNKPFGRLAGFRIIADRLSENVALEPPALDPKVSGPLRNSSASECRRKTVAIIDPEAKAATVARGWARLTVASGRFEIGGLGHAGQNRRS